MSSYILPSILSLSIVLQIASAVTALVLVKTSGYYKPWICIATAILLMALRRVTSFIHMLNTGIFPSSALIPELIALCRSILMLTGLILFRPVFLDIKRHYNDSESKIEQQDITLRESNHRIKNNLAIISSLINLKASSFDKDADLTDLSRQIDTISLLHEKLYKSEDTNSIRLRGYLEDLLESIFSSYGRAALEIEIEDISISSRKAVPLGLIVNEMATNAIKHGFNSKEEPRFSITMEEEEGVQDTAYSLRILNSGNPFPPEISLKNPETTGLQIVSSLVHQLDGSIELQQRHPHPIFVINFPAAEG
ncbi:MAG: sensor histidine kinase [Sediminispirochaetaceae bacterium]